MNTTDIRIIQSLWTWPTRTSGSRQLSGSWYQKRYHFMSWAYSCLQFRKYYERVELYTDAWGKELLIDKLRLPYSAVHVVLDDSTAPHPQLWAKAKLEVFAMQKEPFLHVDGDVFIFAPFGESLEQAPIAAQHLEEDYPYYHVSVAHMREHFSYYPEAMLQEWERNPGVYHAFNCGLVGGQDTDFFRHFAEEALHLIYKNAAHMEQVRAQELNIIFEQHLMYCLAKQQRIPVVCHRHHIPANHAGLTSLQGTPNRRRYVHPVASFKKNPAFCLDLKNKLRREYPEYYYRIEHLTGELALS